MAKYSKTSAATWEERYSTASGNQAKMFKRFSNWYDSLYAVVGINSSPWRSKIYVPVLARQTWALVSKFLSLKPGFEVRLMEEGLGDDDIEARAEKAQRKLEYDYENPYLDETIRNKLFAPLLDAVVCGTGIVKVCWKVDKKIRYERIPKDDGTWDLTKEKKIEKTVAYNDIEPVNIFNVFVSPSATNLYSAPWIIIKEFKTIAELESVNKAQGVEIYRNLDKLSGTTSHDDEFNTYNYSRNRLTNQEDRVDKTVRMVKIFECYEGDTICTYAESSKDAADPTWVLIREQKNPYWHGKYPLVKFHVKNRPYQFWGEGLFETTYRLQAAYNDAFNHFFDQWNLSENSMLIVPERANVNDYVIEPGGVITYRGEQPPQQFKHAAPDPGAFQTVLSLMDSAIEGVTISNYASGLPNSPSDKTKGTATGILRLQEAAGDLVGFMKANFTQSITQIGRMWLSNNQQYMESDLNIMVNNRGKMEPMKISPADLQGDMDLVVDDASMEPASKEEQRDNYMAWVQGQMALKQAADAQHMQFGTPPMLLNFAELSEEQAQRFGIKNFASALIPDKDADQYIAQAQERMSQAAQAEQQPAGKEPETPEMVAFKSIASNYDKATPVIKAELEEIAGLEPDPMRHVEHASMLNQMEMQNQEQTPESPQLNPQADQETVNLANNLAQEGYIDPAILEQLAPMKPSVAEEIQHVQ
jgi:hypothetical protein